MKEHAGFSKVCFLFLSVASFCFLHALETNYFYLHSLLLVKQPDMYQFKWQSPFS